MFTEIWLLRYVVTLVLKNTGSILPSNFDEKLPNILVTFLYPNGLVIGQYFFVWGALGLLLWLHSKARREYLTS